MRKKSKCWIAILVAAIILVIVCAKLNSLDKKLANATGDVIVSLELAFKPPRAASVVDGWRSYVADNGEARNLVKVARKSIHWDWIFIAAYLTLMLAIRSLILTREHPPPPNWAGPLLLILPLAAGFLDALEDLGIYFLLWISNTGGFMFGITALMVGLWAALKFILLFLFAVCVLKISDANLKVLLLPRFSLLMLAIGIVTIFVAQWQEVLLHVAEEEGWPWLSFWLALAALIASLTTWYTARVMYMLKLSSSKTSRAACDDSEPSLSKKWKDMLKPSNMDALENLSKKHTAPLTKRWYPRLLGFLVIPITVLGLIKAVNGDYSRMPAPLSALAIALIIYAIFVICRRGISSFLYSRLSSSRLKEKLEFLDVGVPDDDFGRYEGFRDLPWFTRRVMQTLFALNIIAFLSVWFNPLWFQGVGSAAVVLLAIGLMVPMGNCCVYLGVRYNMPALLLLFILAGLFSFYNDNHWVRLHPEAASTEDAQVPGPLPAKIGNFSGLKNYVLAWAQERADKDDGNGNIPLFIVATEGGGIRAAYWTAQVLANLQDKNPRFADHLFAISGVSGGSLGGAVFASQVAVGLPAGNVSFRRHADAVLKMDFLAPTLATMLFPDLLQRFLPWALFNDRAVTLETCWEDAWEKSWGAKDPVSSATAHKLFAEPFQALWRTQSDTAESTRVPLLFLNSTVVETGNRLIMHPLDFQRTESVSGNRQQIETFADIFQDAEDGRFIMGSSIPLSTAVHLSARFTYVSPAGSTSVVGHRSLDHSDRNPGWIRLVDGGYFENSGTVTALELLTAIKRYQAEDRNAEINKPEAKLANKTEESRKSGFAVNYGLLSRLRPFIINIRNEPIRCDREIEDGQRGKQEPFGEVLSPLWALLNARPARGYQARQALIRQMTDGHQQDYANFMLWELETRLPLGWVLSEAARENMKKQLMYPPCAESTGKKSLCKEESPEDLQCRTNEACAHNRDATEKVIKHLGS